MNFKDVHNDPDDPIGIIIMFFFKWTLYICGIIICIGATVKLFQIMFYL